MTNHLTLWVASIVFLTSCATTKPEAVPDFKDANLPPLKMKVLKPQNAQLTVKNERAVNKKAGNSEQVEKAVLAALSDSLKSGGITLNSKSKNLIAMTLVECENPEDGLECLRILTKVTIKGGSINFENHCSNGYTHGAGKGHAFGDINESYKCALSSFIEHVSQKFETEIF